MSTRITVLLLGLFCSLLAEAGAYRITPLRLDFDPANSKRRTLSVDLSNLGNVPIVVQMEAKAWSQQDGKDILVPTTDIFFAPPIVTIPANGKKTVPVRFKGQPDALLEKTYRFYMEEVAAPNARNRAAMDFKARFGIPIFIAPARQQPLEPEIVIQQTTLDTVVVQINNKGTKHLRVAKLELFPAKFQNAEEAEKPLARTTNNSAGSGYLLAGQKGTWTLSTPKSFPQRDLAIWMFTDLEEAKAIEGAPEGTFKLPFTPEGTPGRAKAPESEPVKIAPLLPPEAGPTP